MRLYEEAASLYMQVGDNMLAIYASEKALRLAERLGEIRAASRAHGIFGRVFGRIGDTAKARENLERAVELARDSDEDETVRALLTLGHHLENAEADYVEPRSPTSSACAGGAHRRRALAGRAARRIRAGRLLPRRLGPGAATRPTPASSSPSARVWSASCAYPYVLRGILAWREATGTSGRGVCRRAHDLAEQVGWSELSFSALYWLALTLRDRGDYVAAVTELDRALDVCERAGLVGQSIEALSARSITLVIAGKVEQGRETAEEAGHLSERLHYPVGNAAALEARAATAEDPQQGKALMAEARELWQGLGRPLDVAICDLLLAHLLKQSDRPAALAALDQAAEQFEALGVAHLAQLARGFATAETTG